MTSYQLVEIFRNCILAEIQPGWQVLRQVRDSRPAWGTHSPFVLFSLGRCHHFALQCDKHRAQLSPPCHEHQRLQIGYWCHCQRRAAASAPGHTGAPEQAILLALQARSTHLRDRRPRRQHVVPGVHDVVPASESTGGVHSRLSRDHMS